MAFVFGSSCNMMLLCLFSLLMLKMMNVAGQSGFVSIDCGIPSQSNYSDPNTGIYYVSDDQFIDTGTNHKISSGYITSSLEKQLLNVRSFRNGTRNCYKIQSVKRNAKYLVRATFMHGNYDGLQQVGPSNPLQFDLHVDVNFWKIVNISDASKVYRVEVIAVALADSMSVCLINTGTGTPFISALELRPLKDTIYRYANATQYMVLIYRNNAGATSNDLIRYPADSYDRIWSPWIFKPYWSEISTASPVLNFANDETEAPSAVMRTAAVPANSSTLLFNWFWADAEVRRNELYVHLHMAELVPNVSRSFSIYLNGDSWWYNYTPPYLKTDVLFSTEPITPQSSEYHWAINSTGLSTLPPILNAMEVHSPMYLTEVATDAVDVAAINAIRENYKVERNWMGDPCAPRDYSWNSLSCSYSSNSPRIVSLNLSSSALSGSISSSFSLLTELKYLDLSYNNLTGEIPDSLGSLSSLQVLNLTGNNFTNPIPVSLLQKSKTGLLLLRIEGNPSLCANAKSCLQKSSKKIVTPVVILLCLIPVLFLAGLFVVLYKRRKPQIFFDGLRNSFRPRNEFYIKQGKYHQDSSRKNRQFTYLELKQITYNFERILGKGGFGVVFHGYLENGTEVAVKMRSESSPQGSNDFLSEAQHLSRVHHKNLVYLIGYCKDEEHTALVFEFMSEGTVQDHLRGKNGARILNWRERLKIALDSAQGLEYLHSGCKRPVIHRDVKTANILLTERFEAKIADFGISKVLPNDMQTHVSTRVVGTQGYLDPEYYTTHRLSDKSDVYSFGVVLLELITGQPPILPAPESSHVLHWVSQRLSRGNIDHVADTRLQGEYNENSMWKCVEVALKCTAPSSHQRPTMSEVVKHLKASLELETPHDRTGNMSSNTESLYTAYTNTSQNSSGKEKHSGKAPAAGIFAAM